MICTRIKSKGEKSAGSTRNMKGGVRPYSYGNPTSHIVCLKKKSSRTLFPSLSIPSYNSHDGSCHYVTSTPSIPLTPLWYFIVLKAKKTTFAFAISKAVNEQNSFWRDPSHHSVRHIRTHPAHASWHSAFHHSFSREVTNLIHTHNSLTISWDVQEIIYWHQGVILHKHLIT